MKILNFHGFMGEADNKNYKALCGIVPEENILSPQLDYKGSSPKEIMDRLSVMVDSEDFIFVGQSLGGWYAGKLSIKFSRPCILTNPCYYPHKLGIITESGMSAEFVRQYSELSVHDRNKNAFTICSDADTVLPDNYDNCVRLSEKVIKAHGGHSSIENLAQQLENTLNEILRITS